MCVSSYLFWTLQQQQCSTILEIKIPINIINEYILLLNFCILRRRGAEGYTHSYRSSSTWYRVLRVYLLHGLYFSLCTHGYCVLTCTEYAVYQSAYTTYSSRRFLSAFRYVLSDTTTSFKDERTRILMYREDETQQSTAVFMYLVSLLVLFLFDLTFGQCEE